MKKVILTLLAVFTVGVNANALSVHRSREEARFLTDKMVYELYLTDDQADDVYEINYDYFRALGPVDGLYDNIFNRRYEDLSYVLYDWQWDYFLSCDYFLYPAYIYRGGWAFGIYNYYARTHFFYGIPRLYYRYNGGHFHHPTYYRGRFNMHRRAVARIPRPAHRTGGGIHHGRINNGQIMNRGGNNHGNMNRGSDNHGNMNRGNNSHGNMDRGNNSHGNMDRGNNNHGNMDRGNNNHGNMNRGNNNHGNMNRGSNNHGNMNRGSNNHGSMNRGSNNHGNMNSRSSSSSMSRGSAIGGSSPSRISRSNSGSHRSNTNSNHISRGSRSHGNGHR